jgi:hypothetical protein
MMTTIMTAVKDDDEVGFNVPHGRELEGLPYAKEKGSRKERSSRQRRETHLKDKIMLRVKGPREANPVVES